MSAIARTEFKHSVLPPATYTLSQLAALIGCSYTVAHEMAQRDALPIPHLRIGRRYLFRRSDVHALLGIIDDDTMGYVPNSAAQPRVAE